MNNKNCPNCGNSDFECEEPEYPGRNMEQEVKCNKCDWEGVQIWSGEEFVFR